jgi:drug/metabolite transporter (DMT)-like permease
MKTKLRAYLAWGAICIIWGTTYLALKIGVTDLPPLLFAGIRWAIAGPLFLLIISFKKYPMPKKEELLPLAIIGISLIGVTNGLVIVAMQWLPSGLTSLLITTLPLWVIMFEFVFPPHLKMNKLLIGGLIIGFIGVSIIFIGDARYIFESEYLFGVVCVFVGVMSWAGGSLYSKSKKISTHPLVSAAFQMFFAGIAQTTVGLMLGEASEFVFTPNSFLAFIYLLFVGSMLGYASYIYAISHLRVSFVATYSYVNPIIALFLGWYVLNEEMDLSIIISAALVLAGIAMVNSGARKAASGQA